VPKWATVVGSEWNVGYYAINYPFFTSLNEWSDDYIGWNQSQVAYYQSHWFNGTPLCGARIPQSNVTVIRNGVAQTQNNPIK
jgi:hypothetical protein